MGSRYDAEHGTDSKYTIHHSRYLLIIYSLSRPKVHIDFPDKFAPDSTHVKRKKIRKAHFYEVRFSFYRYNNYSDQN